MCHLWMSRKTQNEYRLHVQTDNYLSYRSFIASPMTKKHMPDWISDRHCQNNSFTHRRVLWCRTAWGSVIQILNSLTEQYLIQRIHIRWNPLDAMSWERLASLPQKIRLKPFKSCTLFWQVLYWRIVDWCFLFSLLETTKQHQRLSAESHDWALILEQPLKFSRLQDCFCAFSGTVCLQMSPVS